AAQAAPAARAEQLARAAEDPDLLELVLGEPGREAEPVALRPRQRLLELGDAEGLRIGAVERELRAQELRGPVDGEAHEAAAPGIERIVRRVAQDRGLELGDVAVEACLAAGDPPEAIPIEKLPLARELRRALELEPAVDLRVVRRKELGT